MVARRTEKLSAAEELVKSVPGPAVHALAGSVADETFLDAVVQFQGLGFDHIQRVVDKFLIELEMLLQEKHVSLSSTPAARDWLAKHGFDPLMGARPMARLIQDKVKRPLADELLFGKLVGGGRVSIDVRDDDLVVEAQSEPEKLLPATV